jgi:hypothetical protein
MSVTKPPIYTGDLAHKLRAIDTSDLSAIRSAWPDIDTKLNLLFEHFDIPCPSGLGDVHSWRSLALYLAFLHVPGFKFKGRPGKRPGPTKWTRVSTTRLFADVKLKMMRGQSAREACHNLVKSSPLYKGWKPSTLLRRYAAAEEREPAIIELMDKVGPARAEAMLLLIQARFVVPTPPNQLKNVVRNIRT